MYRFPRRAGGVACCALSSFYEDRHAIVDGDPEAALADAGVVTVEGELAVRGIALALFESESRFLYVMFGVHVCKLVFSEIGCIEVRQGRVSRNHEDRR